MADPKPTRADAVRNAVDEAFSAAAGAAAGQAQVTRDRAQELVDELGSAAGRMREVLDDLRPTTFDELRALRTEVEALRDRVAALEAGGSPPAGVTASKPRPRKQD